MALISGGELVLADAIPTSAQSDYPASTGVSLTKLFASYGAIYRKQLWVYTVVRKRALATRRLPFKTYRRLDDGSREDARDTPLATLLREPNPRMSGPFLWEWTSSTFDVHGEAIWFKIRGRDGRPGELWPVHPSNVVVRRKDDGTCEYVYGPGVLLGAKPQYVVSERDVVHFRSYNPDSTVRGLSPLEPLRQTLVNEDAARRSSSAFWNNGARPSGFLSHPNKLGDDTMKRLSAQWSALHGSVDNFGKWAILEEGMKPEILSLSAEEAQYIDTRKLNQIEVCAAYDMPPPAVHILDRATFSNIVEQFRSMYRDTMAPHLSGFEATLAMQLVPEFGRDLYVEFLMDEVLRGSFEARQDAYAKADYMTIAEKRASENLPHIDGTDRILINGAYVPLDAAPVNALGALVRSGFDPESSVEALGMQPIEHTGLFPVTVQGEGALEPTPAAANQALDRMWGRLGTYSSVDDIDPEAITEGLNGEASVVRAALDEATAGGDSIAEFRARLRSALA